ncbi:MAG: DUF4143 domain-containing protein [Candidatus Hydrogenedentes bacterium]|nr:DUF4143 domain-containing protein [Candidatus Hydrogenedentota bacterium]
MHTLLGIPDHNALCGHPVAGTSWEGFVIETLLAAAPDRTLASFYRTSAGAEIDLLLDLPGSARWAIEIKMGLAPKIERGFHQAREDVRPDRSFVVYSGAGRFGIKPGIEAIGLKEMAEELAALE